MKAWFKGYLVMGALISLGLNALSVKQSIAATINVTGTLTADNHYGLFYGNNNGSILNFVGRNEYGGLGSTGGFNWSHAETWNFTIRPQDYLYVVTWDDRSMDESWVGQFSFSTGQTLLSTVDSWEYLVTQKGVNPGDFGEAPAKSELRWEISNALWRSPSDRGLNDGSTLPWGRIPEVVAEATFLNTTTSVDGDRANNNRYTIFRTKLPAVKLAYPRPPESVPEPSSVLGFMVLGAVFSAHSLAKSKR